MSEHEATREYIGLVVSWLASDASGEWDVYPPSTWMPCNHCGIWDDARNMTMREPQPGNYLFTCCACGGADEHQKLDP